ncbi:MAG: MFS transporter [Alphaproteobacteria bacterium]|nr:MFS transporter [Alphaproteobacteria bacterium]
MGLALGVRHVQGLFLLPVTMDHGWSRETFGFAMALQNLTWGIAQPFTGMLADKFGSAKVIATGLIAYATGLFFMVQAESTSAFMLSAGICIGIALSGTAFGAVYGALSRIMPPDRRSWALGLAGAIGGLGQFAMVPAAQTFISMLGWSGALLILAVGMTALLPLVWAMRDQSVSTTSSVDEISMSVAIGEAFRHRGFWMLNLGFLACGFQLAFIATHLPAYLSDRGLSASEGVAALAIIALTNVIGTYLLGLWGGILRRKYILAVLYLVRTVAIALFVFLPLSALSTYLFAAVMGFLWLGTVPLTNGLVSQIFGVRYITTLFGFVFLGHQLGSFFGVWLGGYLFEETGSYDAVWLIAMGVGILATLVHWPINDQTILRKPYVGALV